MNGDFTLEITQAVTCQDMGILVTTRGYAQGEEVSLTIGEKNASKDTNVKLKGIVDADGKVRMRWPAMGCTDHVPSPLLGGDGDETKAEDRMPAGVKHKMPWT